MEKVSLEKLDALYLRYGYDIKKNLSRQELQVYTLNKGVYFGADIVYEKRTDEIHKIQETLSKAGYACRLRQVTDIKEAESFLFDAFFHSNQLKQRLQNKYLKFKETQSRLLKVPYEYIRVSYLLDNAEYKSDKNLIENICERLNENGAQLIIIEAAAGFGKTCTSYELINHIAINKKKFSPIFTELSRDRRAAIFKHILQDVIVNEFHSLLDEKLVIHEIQTGRIPLIIDGFDELLSKEQDKGRDEFEQVETMLSTIGDLLKSEAKIILTGRKTAIFSGDSFNEWIENNPNDFKVSRFLINPPRIEDWLNEDRIERVKQNGIPLKEIANPVLLAFLRSLNSVEFQETIINPEQIVNKYFQSILDREQERQQLRIEPMDQLEIFKKLAKGMMEFDITADSKSWIKELLQEHNIALLESVRKSYPINERPTIDEMCNTLSNHALLDRRGIGDSIGFINDFIFGTFIGDVICLLTQEEVYQISNHMIELASTAFQFQSQNKKDLLWDKINLRPNISKQSIFINEYLLKGIITNSFTEASFADISLSGLSFEKSKQYLGCAFTNCIFDGCFFKHTSFTETYFINCVFRDCEILDKNESSELTMMIINCQDYGSNFINDVNGSNKKLIENTQSITIRKQIFEKYFKKNPRKARNKKLSFLIQEFEFNKRADVIQVLEDLRRNDFIKVNGNNSFLSEKGILLANSKN